MKKFKFQLKYFLSTELSSNLNQIVYIYPLTITEDTNNFFERTLGNW